MEKKLKTNGFEVLGVIGGMGPLSTARFYERIINRTVASIDQDHLDIYISSIGSTPDRTEHILKEGPNPCEKIVENAIKLEKIGATFLAMPCNTAHYFYDDIIKHINIPLINMVEETAQRILKIDSPKRPLLLATEGTIKGKVYENVFKKNKLEIGTPNAETQLLISKLIGVVKEGNLERLNEFLDTLLALEQEYLVILGCTELTVAKEVLRLNGDFIDPTEILVESVLAYANKKIK